METDQISFRTLDYKTGRTLLHEGRTYLFFGGTSYLGLNTHPALVQLYKEGIDRYGLNIGTSRNNNVQLGIYDEAEQYLATRFGFEDSLVVSSGFLASQLAVRALGQDQEGTAIFFAPGAHPALWLDSERPVPTQSFDTWAIETMAQINHSPCSQVIIASDTFASIQPSLYDFSPFLEIEDSKEVCFLLDDSHGFGVFQNPTVIHLQKQNRPNFHFVVVGSLAKGLGVDAGILLGDTAVIAQLRKSTVYAGASPPSPAAMHVLLHGEDIYREQVQKLQERMALFEERIRTDHQTIPGFPVYCFEQAELYDRLLENGIVISSFSYPRPSDPPLYRIVISSLHTRGDIVKLAEVIDSSA